jgi:hypothetical protein
MIKRLTPLLIVFTLAHGKPFGKGTFRTHVLFPPDDQIFPITVGEAWNYISNFGSLGGEFGQALIGYSWPGGAVVNNYYLWGSYFAVGAKVGGDYYVTHHDYPRGEWDPSEDPPVFTGPGKSAYDVLVAMDDFADNPWNNPGRHLGIKVIIRAMAWPHEPYNDFIAHEIYITYDQSQCDIPGATDVLDSVFVGMWYDCDVSGADQTDPHIDDLVCYDGWTNGEWDNPAFQFREPTDEYTILPDSFIPEPDGVPDQYMIWGDEPDDIIVDSSHAWEIQVGDTTILGYLIPRGISYIYDGDDPANPGDDVGEGGMSAGFIGGAWIYTPPSPSDSIWVVDGETLRIVRPWSHQWWNWESDPATDIEVYEYLAGRHPATLTYRYAPHPWDIGAAEFDYRFLSTVGPFRIASGETLKLVWVAGVGQGLNGGTDDYWRGGQWVHGLRHVIEWGYKAYYAGSEHSDPVHPSDPDSDTHWYIPVPPPSPELRYSAKLGAVNLVWDDTPERTPDPLKGRVDFVAYVVYRAMYEPVGWVPLDTLYLDPETGTVAHSYTDTTVKPGFPYYYVVTALDDDGLESPKNNYLKDPDGNPLVIVIPAEVGSVEDVVVVPNPYPGAAPWTATEIADKIEFHNVPAHCKIKIYTLSGDLVQTLVNETGQGSIAWNLLSRSGQKVVSGVYIYKVETPDGDYKVGKFMILK